MFRMLLTLILSPLWYLFRMVELVALRRVAPRPAEQILPANRAFRASCSAAARGGVVAARPPLPLKRYPLRAGRGNRLAAAFGLVSIERTRCFLSLCKRERERVRCDCRAPRLSSLDHGCGSAPSSSSSGRCPLAFGPARRRAVVNKKPTAVRRWVQVNVGKLFCAWNPSAVAAFNQAAQPPPLGNPR